MEIKEILTMQKQVKAKLMSAVALLLVSAILLSTSTYAWFVLSTAPEVSEMKTTAGANGALAIALQSTKAGSSLHERAEITNGVGDTGSNTTWGGLVDLANHYGLEKISLSPARLNLDSSSAVVTGKPLSIPQFGIDGRVSALTPMGTVYYSAGGADGTAGTFVKGDNYGVNIVGKRDDLNGAGASITRTMDRQWLIDTSTAKISTMRAEMLERQTAAISANSKGIIDIVERFVKFAGGEGMPAFTTEDYDTVKSLTDTFRSLLGNAVVALRYALLACCAADLASYPSTPEGEADLSAVYAKYNKLPLQSKTDETTGEQTDSIERIAAENQMKQPKNSSLYLAYGALLTSVQSVSGAQKQVNDAEEFLAESNQGANGSALGAACTTMFNVNRMYIAPRGEKSNFVPIKTDEALGVFNKYTTDLYAVEDSGLFYTMATVLGDHQTNASHTYQVQTGWKWDPNLKKKVPVYEDRAISIDIYASVADSCAGYSAFLNTGCLQSVYNAATRLSVTGTVTYTMEESAHLNAYGYAVDLAFRSSAGGKLLLQQKAANRMTGETSDSAEDRLPEQQNVQGGGSTMTFTVADDMTEAQAKELVQKVCVVFMNTDSGAIWGLAAADAASIQVKTNTAAATQKDTREASMTLALYDWNIENGVLTKGSLREDQQITTLTADTPAYITALVYLDGDAVTGGEMSADTTQSLFGSINLQFCGDQELTVMPYDGLAGE